MTLLSGICLLSTCRICIAPLGPKIQRRLIFLYQQFVTLDLKAKMAFVSSFRSVAFIICREQFSFQLPSVVLLRRKEKLEY